MCIFGENVYVHVKIRSKKIWANVNDFCNYHDHVLCFN